MRENNGWEACRKDKGGLFEKAPPSCYLKNEQGPVTSWQRGRPARAGAGEQER